MSRWIFRKWWLLLCVIVGFAVIGCVLHLAFFGALPFGLLGRPGIQYPVNFWHFSEARLVGLNFPNDYYIFSEKYDLTDAKISFKPPISFERKQMSSHVVKVTFKQPVNESLEVTVKTPVFTESAKIKVYTPLNFLNEFPETWEIRSMVIGIYGHNWSSGMDAIYEMGENFGEDIRRCWSKKKANEVFKQGKESLKKFVDELGKYMNAVNKSLKQFVTDLSSMNPQLLPPSESLRLKKSLDELNEDRKKQYEKVLRNVIKGLNKSLKEQREVSNKVK